MTTQELNAKYGKPKTPLTQLTSPKKDVSSLAAAWGTKSEVVDKGNVGDVAIGFSKKITSTALAPVTDVAKATGAIAIKNADSSESTIQAVDITNKLVDAALKLPKEDPKRLELLQQAMKSLNTISGVATEQSKGLQEFSDKSQDIGGIQAALVPTNDAQKLGGIAADVTLFFAGGGAQLLKAGGTLASKGLRIFADIADASKAGMTTMQLSDALVQAKQFVRLAAKETDPAVKELAVQAQKFIDESGSILGNAARNTGKFLEKPIQTTVNAVKEGTQSATTVIKTASDARNATKAANSTWEVVKPNLTATERAVAVQEGRVVTQGKFGRVTQVPKGSDIEMIDVATPYVSKAKDPVEAVINMKQGIIDKANALRTGLKESGQTWDFKELTNALNKTPRPHLLSGDTEKAFNKTIKVVLDKAKGAANTVIKGKKPTLDQLLDIRQEFDSVVNQQYPNLYDGAMTPIRQAVQNTRRAINNLIESKLPTEGAEAFKASLREQSLLYDAVDNASTKVGKIGTGKITAWMKANPSKAKLLKYGVGVGATSAGAKIIFD